MGFNWIALNRIQFAFKYTCRLLSGLDYWPPDVLGSCILKSSEILGLFGQGLRTLNNSPTTIERSEYVNLRGERSRDSSSSQKARGSSIYIGQGDLGEIKAAHMERLTYTPVIV